MKKNIFFNIMLTSLSISQTLHCDQSLHITIHNKSSRVVLINLTVPSAPTPVGSYGILVNAHETKDITASEYFWFSKIGMGGLKRPGTASKVVIKDILNHSLAKQLILCLPDQPQQEFVITETDYVLTIDNGKKAEFTPMQRATTSK